MQRMRLLTLLIFLGGFADAAHSQWVIQESNTTADLRGIRAVGGGIAWASGTHGTLLRTVDGGRVWSACATPPEAEQLDFRGSGFRREDRNRDVIGQRRPVANLQNHRRLPDLAARFIEPVRT